MKWLLSLMVLFMAVTLRGQTTNTGFAATTPSKTNSLNPRFQAQPGIRKENALLLTSPPRPNEIVKGKVRYSGIGVEIVKLRQPLQLLNPLAGPKYGSPEDNVVRDPINGRVPGLKIFAVRF